MAINAPSLATTNTLNLGSEIQELYDSNVKFYHIDIMDGHYVNNMCFDPKFVRELKERYPDAVADVHMMVTDPGKYIDIMKGYGADYYSFHIDATSFVRRTISDIKAAGMKAGVVINPSQRIDIIDPFANELDMVILMTVEPGFAGQSFLSGSMERLKNLALYRKEKGLKFEITVDGGVTYDLLKDVVRNGADIVVSNPHMIFNQPDGIQSACKRFEEHIRDVKSEI